MRHENQYPRLKSFIRSQYALADGPEQILDEYLGPGDPDGQKLAKEIEHALAENPRDDSLDALVSQLGRFPVNHEFGYRRYLKQTLHFILDQ